MSFLHLIFFQIYLISHLHCPPWVHSLFHHNIQSSVSPLVISTASRFVVCACETPHHQPITRISADDPAEAWGKKSKLLFLDWLLLSIYLHHNGPNLSLTLSLFSRANSSIYMYVCKNPFHSVIKTMQMKLSCFVNSSLFLYPQNPQIDVDLNLCAVVIRHRTSKIGKPVWADKTKRVHDLSIRDREITAVARNSWAERK